MKKEFLRWFTLPEKTDTRRVAMLVIITCAAIVPGALALILTWIASGDLQWETVAPALTVVFLLCAVIAGYGTGSLKRPDSGKRHMTGEAL